ncbi:hypothetical protein [Aquiflexum gelatinilyticum]|uniref:Uncharacterized protein n=1 Tax=Aquiflexum gelatinilyticum TaxID=2961943 RepID=A0A9X2T0L3_9BACT|nr:hypothetical protein [Aquiflexum gelatinilyticum]MCR9015723.1 hypothetical protein [Aquiflexum gelatinilyticum]
MEANQEKTYLAVDDRWAIFGTNSIDEHIHKNVVKGVFDDTVPKEIIGDFKTIEYLQVYAYYHWPMMDEALSKGLRLLEMAIKLKAKELKIPLQNSGEKPKDKNFNQLTNEVCAEEPLIQLKETIHHLRNIRNILTHTDSNDFVGGTGDIVKRNLMRLVNLINDLFLAPEVLKSKLVLEKAERAVFVKNYLNRLTISPPFTKEHFMGIAEWAFEEKKYMDKLWENKIKGLPVISFKTDKNSH